MRSVNLVVACFACTAVGRSSQHMSASEDSLRASGNPATIDRDASLADSTQLPTFQSQALQTLAFVILRESSPALGFRMPSVGSKGRTKGTINNGGNPGGTKDAIDRSSADSSSQGENDSGKSMPAHNLQQDSPSNLLLSTWSDSPRWWVEEMGRAVLDTINTKSTLLASGKEIPAAYGTKVTIDKIDVRHAQAKNFKEIERSRDKILFDIEDVSIKVRVFFDKLRVMKIPMLGNKVWNDETYMDFSIEGGIRAGYLKDSVDGVWEPICILNTAPFSTLPQPLRVVVDFSINKPFNFLDNLRFLTVPITKNVIKCLVRIALSNFRKRHPFIFLEHDMATSVKAKMSIVRGGVREGLLDLWYFVTPWRQLFRG